MTGSSVVDGGMASDFLAPLDKNYMDGLDMAFTRVVDLGRLSVILVPNRTINLCFDHAEELSWYCPKNDRRSQICEIPEKTKGPP